MTSTYHIIKIVFKAISMGYIHGFQYFEGYKILCFLYEQ